MERISTFDDWVDYFNKWQDDIGLDKERDWVYPVGEQTSA